MNTALQILSPLLPFLYGISFANYCLYYLKWDTKDKSAYVRLGPQFLVVTLMVHIAYTVLLGVAYGHHPMASLYEVFSFVGLTLGIVYLIIETWRQNKMTGIFVIPVIFMLQVASALGIEPTRDINPILLESPFGMHTTCLSLAYSGFFLSAVYGTMLLKFHHALRTKKFTVAFERLPSLDVLARMNRGAALVGFVFMTLGIGFGIWWAGNSVPQFWMDAKVGSTILVWVFYGIALIGHYFIKLDNKRIAILLLAAFAVLICVTVIANIFLPGWHQFEG